MPVVQNFKIMISTDTDLIALKKLLVDSTHRGIIYLNITNNLVEEFNAILETREDLSVWLIIDTYLSRWPELVTNNLWGLYLHFAPEQSEFDQLVQRIHDRSAKYLEMLEFWMPEYSISILEKYHYDEHNGAKAKGEVQRAGYYREFDFYPPDYISSDDDDE